MFGTVTAVDKSYAVYFEAMGYDLVVHDWITQASWKVSKIITLACINHGEAKMANGVLTWSFRKPRTKNWKGHLSNPNLFSGCINNNGKLLVFRAAWSQTGWRNQHLHLLTNGSSIPLPEVSGGRRRWFQIFILHLGNASYMKKHGRSWSHCFMESCGKSVARNVESHTLRYYILSENSRTINTPQPKYSYLQISPL